MIRCWLFGHQPLMQQKRDGGGHVVKPHAIRWVCGVCHQPLGETALTPKWSLLARLRRQASRRRRAA